MFLLRLFNLNKTCQHEGVSPNLEFAYCPDCGKFIANEWYITRCACCGIKLKSISKGDKIYPQYKYCTNCGSQEFVVEKLPKINFIDINFAVLIKKVVEFGNRVNSIQCWQDKNSVQPKLLVQYQ